MLHHRQHLHKLRQASHSHLLASSQTSRSHVVSKELGTQENGTQQSVKRNNSNSDSLSKWGAKKSPKKISPGKRSTRESDAWMRIAFRKRNLIVWPYFLIRVFPFSVAWIKSSSKLHTQPPIPTRESLRHLCWPCLPSQLCLDSF